MVRAPVDHETLHWARREGRVALDELAKTLNVSLSRVEQFESGEAMPTFRQLSLIAKKLDRPLGFFFAPAPKVSDVPSAADFRGRGADELPSILVREMRRAEERRQAMLDLGETGRSDLKLHPLTCESCRTEAVDLRRQLGLSPTFVPSEHEPNRVFEFWRRLVESHGILVFVTSRIGLATFRGLSIHRDPFPIILVNGADSHFGRVFTLFHELGHLANHRNGVCSLREDLRVEAVANAFAAEFLMPEAAVRKNLPRINDPHELAAELAAAFKVSHLAAAVRLRALGLIDEEDLGEVRECQEAAWQRNLNARKSAGGFVPQWRLKYRDLGSTYIGTVAQALEDRRIDMTDASHLLNARVPMVDQLVGEFYKRGHAG